MESFASFESSSSSVSHSSTADIHLIRTLSYSPNLHKLECYFTSVFGGLLKMSQNEDLACKREPRMGIQVKLFWKVGLGCYYQFLQAPWLLSKMIFDSITSSADVIVKDQFCGLMSVFGFADLKHIATLLFRMMDCKREGRVSKEEMKAFLRKIFACLSPTWLQSYKEASLAIESTIHQYFAQSLNIDLQSFKRQCFRTTNDPFLEITLYLAKKLDIQGRLFRYEHAQEFKKLSKPLQIPGVYGFFFTIQGFLSSQFTKFKEQAEYLNSASSSSQNTTCTLFSNSTHLSQVTSQPSSPFHIYCRGVLLQKVIRDRQPSLIDCLFQLRGQQLYMTHIEGQEVEGAVMFLIAARAVLVDKGMEEVGMRNVYRFDLSYGDQSKTFYSPSLEEHQKWINAFNCILKRPRWVDESFKEEEDDWLGSGIRIERIEKSQLNEQEIERTRIQLDLMMLCRHKHIVPLLDTYELPDCFLLARPAHQCLKTVPEYFRSETSFLAEPQIKVIISQIAMALFYLKDLGVFHGDIRPENIMVLRKPERGLHVAIGGHFEAAMLPSAGGLEVLGEWKYMAPQLLHIRSSHPHAGDVYSLGVTTYELLTGVHPFDQTSKSKFLEELLHRQPSFKRDFSKKSISLEAVSFCKQMMVKDPKKRLKIEDVLSHKWLCGGPLRKARLNPSGSNHFRLFALG